MINKIEILKEIEKLYKEYNSDRPHLWLMINGESSTKMLTEEETKHRIIGALSALSEIEERILKLKK